MTKFFKTDKGYVNMAHVTKIIPHKDGTHTLHLTNGETAESSRWADPLQETQNYIANHDVNIKACLFFRGEEENDSTVYVEMIPIIGWRMEGKIAIPVTPDFELDFDSSQSGDSAQLAILYPDGRVFRWNVGGEFSSVQEAKDYFQKIWNHKPN